MSENCDALFIHPGNTQKNYQDLLDEFTAIATPSWTLLLINFLQNQGHTIKLHDVNIDGWNDDICSHIISKYDPELIIMMCYGHHPSASTQTMTSVREISRTLKKYNNHLPIAIGGTHPSALPEMTLNTENIDFVIHGEGAYPISMLIHTIKGKSCLSSCQGISYLKNKQLITLPPSPLLKNLDQEFSDYAWDLLPNLNIYRAHNMHCFQDFDKSNKKDFSDIRSPYATIYTSLGCPYNCTYCCINSIFGRNTIRYWQISTIMVWIDKLVNTYNIKNIRLDDELFILSPKRVESFCDQLIERNYDLNLWVYGRIDTIKPSLIKKMKKAGINWICLGIESGNKDVRNQVNKDVGIDIFNIVNTIKDHGINVLGNFIFGLPSDNFKTMQETLQLAQDLNCEFVNFYSCMAYPGSALYDFHIQNGNTLSTDWNTYSQLGYHSLPLPTKYLTSKEVLQFRDQAIQDFFTNSQYISMIMEKFGPKVTAHINRMLSIKLKRKILEETEII